jgi:transcriptional pleiotropic regulator of transition state genes
MMRFGPAGRTPVAARPVGRAGPGPGVSTVKMIGTARRIDQLGRVVVPAELRKLMGIRQGDLLDIRFEEGRLVLLKIEPECAICGGLHDLQPFHEKHICSSCVRELKPA